MSTQFDSSIVDLDRTDELPVLNVEEYEASLAANEKRLSRTDTWAVQKIPAVDEPDESADAVPADHAAKPIAHVEALTSDIEPILRRIAELEAEIAETHETNATLQMVCEALRDGRAKQEQQIEAFQADNARLCEDRAQSDARSRSLNQQLSERAESLAALEKCFSDEKDIAAHLSQQLAAKLMDWEKAGSIIELRNRTIEDLTREGADLNQRLQRELATSADLTARLATADESLHETHALLLEHEDVIGQKDTQLVRAQAQIQSLTEERDALRTASAEFVARAADLEQKDAERAQLRDELVAALAEAQQQAKLLNESTHELGRLRSELVEREHAIRMHDKQTADLTTQLQAAHQERTSMSVQIDNARERAKKLTDQIFSRDNRIAALEADLAVHTEALATIRRDVNRIGHRADAAVDEVEHLLEPVEHAGPTIHLTGEVLTVGRTNDNDICIPSKLVSRSHARLLVGPTGVIIEDAKSMNGCYVNGEQIRQHLMRDGDVLELGGMRYRLRSRAVRDTRIQSTNISQLSSAPRRTGARTTK